MSITPQINYKLLIVTGISLLLMECLSWFVYTHQFFAPYILVAFGILMCAVTFYRPLFGFLLIFIENIVGSKGHLFFAHISLPAIGTIDISIRLTLFITFFLVCGIWSIIHYKSIFSKLKDKLAILKENYYILLVLVMILSVSVALLKHNDIGNIFNDINNYIYFALIIPLLFVRNNSFTQSLLITFAVACIIHIAIKSFFVYIIFGYVPGHYLSIFYKWLRDTGIAEITYIRGPYYRIFFQNHIYSMIGYMVSLGLMISRLSMGDTWKQLWSRHKGLLFFNFITLSTLVLSLSRSMWLGTLLASLIGLCYVLRFKLLRIQQIIKVIGYTLTTVLCAALIVVYINQLDFSGRGSDFLKDRLITTNDAAGEARLQLLGPLWAGIKEDVLFGAGVGKTITYFSRDPRILAKVSSGIYTTYAFEWGYLDFWLKFGGIGLIVFVSFYTKLVRKIHRYILNTKMNSMWFGIFLGLCALLGTHITTPYLNHPLGIMLVLLISWSIFSYEQSTHNESL